MIRPATSSGLPSRPTGICGRIFDVEDLLRDRRHHLRADVAGRDRVDGDALLRDLERERLGEAVHAGLGGRVVGLPERALRAVHRRDVDDAAPVALDHAVGDLLGHVEQAVEVGAHDRVPVDLVHLLEGHVARDAGVVDQHVDRADLALHLGDRARARIDSRRRRTARRGCRSRCPSSARPTRRAWCCRASR